MLAVVFSSCTIEINSHELEWSHGVEVFVSDCDARRASITLIGNTKAGDGIWMLKHKITAGQVGGDYDK